MCHVCETAPSPPPRGGPGGLAPVSAALLTVRHDTRHRPSVGLPGLGETDGRVGACLRCPVSRLAKALGAGVLGLCHPSRSGAPPRNRSTQLRVLHSRSLVMIWIFPERGTKPWPYEGRRKVFLPRGHHYPEHPAYLSSVLCWPGHPAGPFCLPWAASGSTLWYPRLPPEQAEGGAEIGLGFSAPPGPLAIGRCLSCWCHFGRTRPPPADFPVNVCLFIL